MTWIYSRCAAKDAQNQGMRPEQNALIHYFWRHGINLTNAQEELVTELDIAFAAAGLPGFALNLGPTLSRLAFGLMYEIGGKSSYSIHRIKE